MLPVTLALILVLSVPCCKKKKSTESGTVNLFSILLQYGIQ